LSVLQVNLEPIQRAYDAKRFLHHMRIDLGSLHGSMPEEFLHRTNIDTSLQHMRGKPPVTLSPLSPNISPTKAFSSCAITAGIPTRCAVSARNTPRRTRRKPGTWTKRSTSSTCPNTDPAAFPPKNGANSSTPFLPHVFRPNSFFTDFPPKANS